MKRNIAVVGYVGLSISTLLAQHQMAVDATPEKVEKINKRISLIQEEYIEKCFAEKKLVSATLDVKVAYLDAEFGYSGAYNYDAVENYFDTSHVEKVIDLVLEEKPDAVKKSTFLWVWTM